MAKTKAPIEEEIPEIEIIINEPAPHQSTPEDKGDK